VPSIALGAGEVTLVKLSAAFAAFASGGVVRTPVLIRRVVDNDGLVLFQDDGAPARAMSAQTAFIVASMLQDVVNFGTAARVRALGFWLPAGGKTGTTNDYVDTWFVGFTPRVLTGVWVGFDQPRTIMPRAYAADVAVPVWTAIMKVATEGDESEWLSRPDGLVAVPICRISGKRAGEGCDYVIVDDASGAPQVRSMAYTEYFVKGTEPSQACDLHLTAGPGTHLAGAAAAAELGAPQIAADLAPMDAMPRPPARGDGRGATGAEPAAAKAAPAASPAPEPKKRGFWSRVFGTGKDQYKKPAAAPPH
jgi:membrane carboxypeptidase/penicillin-binding protein